MQTYLEINEFCKLVHLNRDVVENMIEKGSLKTKEEDGVLYIEATQGTMSVIPVKETSLNAENVELVGENFVEKTIGTILTLHEKVLDAKDETLEALKSENKFLKDALFSMQELYEEDRKSVDLLSTQLKNSQDEVEFLKRKYKLMWNKTIENYKE